MSNEVSFFQAMKVFNDIPQITYDKASPTLKGKFNSMSIACAMFENDEFFRWLNQLCSFLQDL